MLINNPFETCLHSLPFYPTNDAQNALRPVWGEGDEQLGQMSFMSHRIATSEQNLIWPPGTESLQLF